jgi:hypothetical protein
VAVNFCSSRIKTTTKTLWSHLEGSIPSTIGPQRSMPQQRLKPLKVQYFPADAAGRNAIDSKSSPFIITIFIARIPVFYFIFVILEERNKRERKKNSASSFGGHSEIGGSQ